MSFFDIALLIIVACFACIGFWAGFVYAVGSLVGVFLGVYVAGKYYAGFSSIIGHGAWAKVIAFYILFFVVSRVIGIVFWILNKIVRILSILPLVGFANRIAGGIFGIIEGVVFVGAAVYVLSRFQLGGFVSQILSTSTVAPFFMKIGQLLSPLFPTLPL